MLQVRRQARFKMAFSLQEYKHKLLEGRCNQMAKESLSCSVLKKESTSARVALQVPPIHLKHMEVACDCHNI